MRQLPPRIGPFRTSSAIAAAIAVLVVVVLLIARACGAGDDPGAGSDRSRTTGPAAPATSSSSAGTAIDGDDDDGAGAQPPDVAPSVAVGRPAPTAVAEAFAQAWVQRTLPGDQWRARLQPLTTPAAFASLTDVDPLGVPAERVTGHAKVVLSDAGFALCLVPLDFGDLELRLLSQPDGRWLVDSISWNRS